MIVGTGIDAVNIERASLLSQHMIEKTFHPLEILEIKRIEKEAPLRRAEYIASRFAVKEAYAKARGLGFCDTIVPNEICTCKDSSGKPFIVLYGKTLENASPCSVYVSITHEKPLAIAFVVLEDSNGKK